MIPEKGIDNLHRAVHRTSPNGPTRSALPQRRHAPIDMDQRVSTSGAAIVMDAVRVYSADSGRARICVCLAPSLETRQLRSVSLDLARPNPIKLVVD